MEKCQDCKKEFLKKLPKQLYCEPCRDRAYFVTPTTLYTKRQKGRFTDMARERRGLNLKALARKLQIPTSTLYGWDYGGIPRDYNQVLKVSDYLGCTPEDLLSPEALEELLRDRRQSC